MAGKVEAHKDAVLQLIRGTAWTTLSNEYIALLHTNPTDDDMTTGTPAAETTYTNYVRKTVGTIGSFWGSPEDQTSGTVRRVRNAAVFNFDTCGATGDTLNGFCVASHVSSALSSVGLYWNSITGAPKTVNANDPVSIAQYALVVTEQ